MRNSSLKKKFIRTIFIAVGIAAILGVIYPLLIIYTVRTSGKKFVKVMNSHDLALYDSYFLPDTIFIVNGKSIKYSYIRDKIVDKEFSIREDSFYAPTDVPFDTEYMDYFKKTEFEIGLHGGMILKYGDRDVEVVIDGILVLKRYGLNLRAKEVHLADITDESLEQYKAYEYMFSD